jgi:CTP-dependent riboflavin kinase
MCEIKKGLHMSKIILQTVVETAPASNSITSLISSEGIPLVELRKNLGLTKKAAIKAIKWLQDNGYITVVKSRTGKIKVFLTDKHLNDNEKIMEDF